MSTNEAVEFLRDFIESHDDDEETGKAIAAVDVLEKAAGPVHDHGFAPYSVDCIRCVQQSMSFNNEVYDQRERELKLEIERLQDAWLCDEGITPDGDLRAMVSRTVARAAEAEALLDKIHRLSDPNRGRAESPKAAETKEGT